MKPLDRRTALEALGVPADGTAGTGGARLRRGDPGGPAFRSVFVDSRKPERHGLFVALVGERHDGHDHLREAVEGGAAGLVVSRPEAVPDDLPDGPLVAVVDDTLDALGRLAGAVRSGLPAPHAEARSGGERASFAEGALVAVTGSVGKTLLKELAAAALADFGPTTRSPGNWNNEVGVPLSLFATSGEERYVVVELAMNHPGEIARLTRIARPDVGVVTAARAMHVAAFEDPDGRSGPDPVEAIADAKAELWDELPEGGVAVACADDARVLERARRLRPEGLVTWGEQDEADVRLTASRQDRRGLRATIELPARDGGATRGRRTVRVQLPVLGRHNALNAAGALAVAYALGLDPERAAWSMERHLELPPHRLALHDGPSGLTILDDAYNAGPDSTRAALDTLAAVAADAPARAAVLGSMWELGREAPSMHRAIGAHAGRCGLDWVGATGPYAEATAEGAREAGVPTVRVAAEAPELADELRAFAAEGRWLLLKGSRAERVERLLDLLRHDERPDVSSDEG